MSEPVAELLPPSTLEAYDRLRADCGLLPSLDVAVIEIRGDDRKGWLQGQATNDLKQLDAGASYAFCLCQPTGQIVAICDIWGFADRFLLTCDRSSATAFLQRVEQMVILEDVTAVEITQEYAHLSIQGPNATRELSGRLDLPTLDAGEVGDVICLRSNRTGLGGWDLLIPILDAKKAKAIAKGIAIVDQLAYDIARLEAGIPKIGVDVDHKTMPPELGPAFEARHVSYKKGCYTGQEVLMRIHSRGHTNRTWVALYAEHALARGATVAVGKRQDAGTVTSSAYSPDYGFIAGAMVRNEAVLDGESVMVNGLQAELRHMPVLRFD